MFSPQFSLQRFSLEATPTPYAYAVADFLFCLSVCWYGHPATYKGLCLSRSQVAPSPWQADLIAELSNWKLQDGLIHPCPCCTSDGSKDHAASRLMLPPAVRAPAEGERSVPLHRAGAGTGRGASGGQQVKGIVSGRLLHS